MAKYHLQLRTESVVATALEIESDDLTQLRIELARFVGELLKDHAQQIWVDEDWRVDVTNEAGLIPVCDANSRHRHAGNPADEAAAGLGTASPIGDWEQTSALACPYPSQLMEVQSPSA